MNDSVRYGTICFAAKRMKIEKLRNYVSVNTIQLVESCV